MLDSSEELGHEMWGGEEEAEDADTHTHTHTAIRFENCT